MFIYILFLLVFPSFIHSNVPYHETQIYGSFSLGFYYIDILVGMPMSQHTFLIDTTSQIHSLDCLFCGSCNLNPSETQQSNISSTLIYASCQNNSNLCTNCISNQSNSRCKYNIVENGHQYIGYYIFDYLKFSSSQRIITNQSNFNQKSLTPLACHINKDQVLLADGKIGLSPKNLELIRKTNKYHLNSSGSSFSICFAQNNGIFYIGKVGQQKAVKIKFKQNSSNYSLLITDISVGGIKFNVIKSGNKSSEQFIISSASKYSQFPKLYYYKLISILQQVCRSVDCISKESSIVKCYIIDDTNLLSRFPNITLHIDQSKINWNPNSYLVRQNNTYCLSIIEGQDFVFGITWIQNRLITFNAEKNIVLVSDSSCGGENFNQQNQDQDEHQPQILGIAFSTFVLGSILMLVLAIVIAILFKRFWNHQQEQDSQNQQISTSTPQIQLVQQQHADDVQLGENIPSNQQISLQ